MRGRFRGIGAAYGKHVRLGDLIAILLFSNEILMALANVGISIVAARRPFGLGRLWGLLSGFRASFRYPIDPSTKRYAPPMQTPAALPRNSAPNEGPTLRDT